MTDRENKIIFGIGGMFLLSVLMLVVFQEQLINKVAHRVIQQLQKEYSPSPYGPGIDPDKLDMDKVKNESK